MSTKTEIFIALANNKEQHYSQIVQEVQRIQKENNQKITRASNIERETRKLAQSKIIERTKKGYFRLKEVNK